MSLLASSTFAVDPLLRLHQDDMRALNAILDRPHGREILLALDVQHWIVGFGGEVEFEG